MKQSENLGAYKKILLVSVTTIVAEMTTFLVGLTMTRLQLHGESVLVGSTRSTNAFWVTSEIVREQGPAGLYKGLSSAILRHLFYTPIRIIEYEQLRSSLKSDDGSFSLPAKALSDGISGIVAQLVACPTNLVKVRMQADGRTVAQGM
ncbi:hypothetical protein ACFX15_012738 [Malus domestica]